jgi:hypothetical protein
MLYILMYPVLRITFMLNFLDTFSVGVTEHMLDMIPGEEKVDSSKATAEMRLKTSIHQNF